MQREPCKQHCRPLRGTTALLVFKLRAFQVNHIILFAEENKRLSLQTCELNVSKHIHDSPSSLTCLAGIASVSETLLRKSNCFLKTSVDLLEEHAGKSSISVSVYAPYGKRADSLGGAAVVGRRCRDRTGAWGPDKALPGDLSTVKIHHVVF